MDYKHMKGGIYYICVVHTYRYIYMYAKSIDKHVQSVLHTDVHTYICICNMYTPITISIVCLRRYVHMNIYSTYRGSCVVCNFSCT